MARPGQDPVAKDDVPWWMKFGGRGVGTVGGFSEILFYLLSFISEQFTIKQTVFIRLFSCLKYLHIH